MGTQLVPVKAPSTPGGTLVSPFVVSLLMIVESITLQS